MTMPRLAALLCILIFLGVSARAGADTTVVFKVDAPNPDISIRLTDALVRAVSSRGLTPTRADATAQEAAQLLECNPSEATCLESMAATTDAGAVIAASARSEGDALVVDVTYLRRGEAPTSRRFELPGDPAAAATRLQADVVTILGGDEQPAPAPAPAPTPVPEASVSTDSGGGFSGRRVRAYSWIVAVSGVALLGASLAFKVKADGLESDVEDAPRMTAADLDALRGLEEDGKTATTLSNVFFWTGAAALVAGTSLILVQGMSADDRDAALTVAPVPLPGGAGFAARLELP